MEHIGLFEFPETSAEVDSWQPIVNHRALARTVLCVVRTRIEGAWAAYCDSVLGSDHLFERDEVLRIGSKMDERYARAIFPDMPEDLPYAR